MGERCSLPPSLSVTAQEGESMLRGGEGTAEGLLSSRFDREVRDLHDYVQANSSLLMEAKQECTSSSSRKAHRALRTQLNLIEKLDSHSFRDQAILIPLVTALQKINVHWEQRWPGKRIATRVLLLCCRLSRLSRFLVSGHQPSLALHTHYSSQKSVESGMVSPLDEEAFPSQDGESLVKKGDN